MNTYISIGLYPISLTTKYTKYIKMVPCINMLSNWVFSPQPEDWPCQCCDAPRALDHEDGYWICDNQQRTWRVLNTPFNPDSPHAPEQCCGGCHIHSLITDEIIQLQHAEITGLYWGDLLLANEYEAQVAETPEQRAERLKAEQTKEFERALAIRASDMERYARLKAQTNTEMIKAGNGKKVPVIRKILEPCKWLYLDESAPKDQWRIIRDGKKEPPYRRYLTGAMCWAWEYIDPKTKNRVVKHTCDHQHPGEKDWHDEWNTDSQWRPISTTRDFSSLRTSKQNNSTTLSAPPVRPTAPKGRKNNRNYFLDLDDFEC